MKLDPPLIAAYWFGLSAFLACGSGDDKKTVRGVGDGGETSAGAGAGGFSSGATGDGGTAGTPGIETGGDGGQNPAQGAGTGGTGGDAHQGGAGGLGEEPEIIGAVVDCVTGSDQQNGTLDAPFQTLAKAAEVASSGTTIVVRDGLCDETTQPPFNGASGAVQLADGVRLRAETPGGVTFHGVNGLRSAGVRFLGSGSIHGIHFERFGRAISTSAGSVFVSACTFNDVYQGYPIAATGTAEVTLEPAGVENYIGDNQRTFAEIADTAKLTVLGGNIEGALDSGISGGALFMVRDSGQLLLDGVTITDALHGGVVVSGSSQATLRDTTLTNVTAGACCNNSSVRVAGTSTLTLERSHISASRGSGVILNAGSPVLVLTDSSVSDSAGPGITAAIYSDSYPNITLTGSTISDNSAGIFLNYSATLTIEDSFITDNGPVSGRGIDVNPTQVYQVHVRGTTISGHGSDGVLAFGAAGSSLDFGRGDDLGGNTFAGNVLSNTVTLANMRVQVAANTTVYAAGNTWDPGIQGAAPAQSSSPAPGQYAVSSGNAHDVTGTQSGKNFIIGGANAATTTLRLAEDACLVTQSCN